MAEAQEAEIDDEIGSAETLRRTVEAVESGLPPEVRWLTVEIGVSGFPHDETLIGEVCVGFVCVYVFSSLLSLLVFSTSHFCHSLFSHSRTI